MFERFEDGAFLDFVLDDFVLRRGFSHPDEMQLVHVHRLRLLVDLDVVGDDPPLLVEVVVLAVVSAKTMLEFQVVSGKGLLFFGTFDAERNEVSFGVFFRTLAGSLAVEITIMETCSTS